MLKSVDLRLAILGTVAACAIAVLPTPLLAQTAANVAVVINENSPASVQIGEHYVSRRGIPAPNVIRLAIGPQETISRAQYAADIEGPIAQALARHGLQDRVLYLVLTKGVPLRVTGTSGLRGTAASVDSELTLLYRRMTGRPVPPSGPVDNPYYAGERSDEVARPFSHRDYDIYLVTRLDGFTADDVMSMIDRGIPPETRGSVVLDQRADAGSRIGDGWMLETAEAIRRRKPIRGVVLDQTAQRAAVDEPVLGYFSWGSTDPSIRGGALEIPFANGAIAAILGTGDAATFEPKPDTAGAMAPNLVKAGASGVGAHVAEPYFQSSFRPQILFAAYLDGLGLADAFYSALPHLSWQSVVVGDPLVRPFGRPSPAADFVPPVDPITTLPSWFSARRLDSLRADLPRVDRTALLQMIAAEAALAREDRTAAIESLAKAAELAPDLVVVHQRLASLHDEAGDTTKAIEGYRRVLALDARNVVAMNNLAYRLATDGTSLEEALALAQKARTLAADSAAVADTLGWIHFLRGNTAEALPLLREASKRMPTSPDIRLHAAVVLAATGALAEAREHLEAALKLDAALEAREDVQKLVEQLRK